MSDIYDRATALMTAMYSAGLNASTLVRAYELRTLPHALAHRVWVTLTKGNHVYTDGDVLAALEHGDVQAIKRAACPPVSEETHKHIHEIVADPYFQTRFRLPGA